MLLCQTSTRSPTCCGTAQIMMCRYAPGVTVSAKRLLANTFVPWHCSAQGFLMDGRMRHTCSSSTALHVS